MSNPPDDQGITRNEEQQQQQAQQPEQQLQREQPDDEPLEETGREIHGLLVSYRDDEIDDCVHAALQGKKRVHYKCMDVYSNFVAFGTSVGAIYLFRLTTITHASCKLALVIPCDQGSIEVVRFLPGSLQSNDLLVAIGTSRGSLVIFQLICFDELSVRSHELYRAEEFTKSAQESAVRIKSIEYDQDYLTDNYDFVSQANPNCSFTKLYICDQSERIFVLESSSIYPAFKLLYSNRPAHVLSVDESTINQVCVHKSQLLMSTDEKTRLFCEHSNELVTIGKRQRKTKGFFGACFFNPNYKPPRMMPSSLARSRANMSTSQQTMYSSTNSLMDLENMLIFVARPKFSLWQVNNRREVMLTHIFDSSIRNTPSSCAIRLNNAPIGRLDEDDPRDVEQAFSGNGARASAAGGPRGDHFEKLIQIFSTTLGNLLLSYTKQELFVLDPIRAQLIAWYQHDKPITQVCCNENEIFILSELNRRQFKVDRLILLAPTQFVLELHRTNRFLSLMVFVQMFQQQLRQLMALPLSGPSTITTEGGLLRNIIWNTWRECSDAAATDAKGANGVAGRASPLSLASSSSTSSSTSTLDGEEAVDQMDREQQQQPQPPLPPALRIDLDKFDGFKRMVEEIVEESRELKQSIENLADSRLLFTVSNENVERLCSEPYASMVSLDISIANLHTSHVVHFSQEALQRHKSIAKLSQSIMNLNRLKRASTQASLLVDEETAERRLRNSIVDMSRNQEINFNDKRVVVEQLRPKQRGEQSAKTVDTKNVFNIIREVEESRKEQQQQRQKQQQGGENGGQLASSEQLEESALEPTLSVSLRERLGQEQPPVKQQQQQPQIVEQQVEVADETRCAHCLWPRARAHLKPMHHSQQIQHNWIQENLLPDFETNVALIEERAFKHGLWHLILKCYAFRGQLDDYITCCIMLDDIRLLNIDRFASTSWNEEQLIDRVFEHLQLKLDSAMSAEDRTSSDSNLTDDRGHCFKCKRALPSAPAEHSDDGEQSVENTYSKLSHDEEDDISFNLVNLFRKFMLRKDADVKRAVGRLLQHPDLVNRSKISANFYLQAIANQCAAIRRTRLKV